MTEIKNEKIGWLMVAELSLGLIMFVIYNYTGLENVEFLFLALSNFAVAFTLDKYYYTEGYYIDD